MNFSPFGDIVSFSVGPALLGGAIIGIAVSLLLLTTGRVAGISGIVGGLLSPMRGDIAWRVAFIIGMMVVGVAALVLEPKAITYDLTRGIAPMVVAGLLVGIGTRVGGGCTSGHGVCGISRMSPRSIVATITFMAAGAVTVAALRNVWSAS
jgi:uncharacterized protein